MKNFFVILILLMFISCESEQHKMEFNYLSTNGVVVQLQSVDTKDKNVRTLVRFRKPHYNYEVFEYIWFETEKGKYNIGDTLKLQ